ncbi:MULTISPECIES: formate dehydrogenase accessory sulfurtransferase FdhD [Ferrimonas]|uniref:formate dehydrogenase accessory sulfurtransferase FdhD n=1 Tax=Ferrimonas TaxID=44011 RepID=UPI0004117103|nr:MULTISPECIES: formate dehydrogenase accessory sulfurtransferase FdhD [Ferrimonas]USD37516.1 formate dehydrogenase accessory sulfurtransferase FdhD [Ferrimonas sp. SCSIO 43195]
MPQFSRTDTDAPLTKSVVAIDASGQPQERQIACERPLTLYLNWQPIVTLMTLGARPEKLALGYLKNQGFISDIDKVESVIVDWDVNSAAVITSESTDGLKEKLSEKTVTSGCGQGSVFGSFMAGLDEIQLPVPAIKQSTIYGLLKNLGEYNETYKNAGAVHGCGVCRDAEILSFVEDIGRHNAVDTLAGELFLGRQNGDDLIFYTTGRLTSEMVIKVAKMGIPVLVSRSGITEMGLELAQKMGITLVSRAKGRHFLVYNGADTIDFDEVQA